MKPTRHTTTLLPRIVPAETEWHRLNALGQLVDSRLRAAGVGLTMGGEPTFISDSDFESPQWQTAALGTDKRRIAGQLLTVLQERFNLQGSLLHYGLGKLYPGEHQPRWALGCYWRNDGTPLWKYPELLAADAVNCGHNPQTVARFAERLIVHLGISSSGCHTAVERLTGQQAGTVIPLLPVQQGQHLRWTTCRWKTSNSAGSLQLLPGNSQLGMRLPLQDIEWAETLTEEANVPLSAPATQTDGPTIESPPNSIAIALCIEVRDSTLRIFCPP